MGFVRVVALTPENWERHQRGEPPSPHPPPLVTRGKCEGRSPFAVTSSPKGNPTPTHLRWHYSNSSAPARDSCKG